MQTRLDRQQATPYENQRPRYLTPDLVRKDPGRRDGLPPVTSNVIKFTPDGSGLDRYTANIPNGLDAIEAFELAVKKKKISGTKIRSCALVVGGLREQNSHTLGVHGGYTVAEWTLERGLVVHPDWKSQVAGLPRPRIVPALQSRNE